MNDRDLEDLARADYAGCDCCWCASLCHGVPGVYDPWMAERLLDADPDAFLASTVIDYYMGEPPTFYLRPRNLGQDGGRVAPAAPSLEPCVHLGPAGCRLDRADMPLGCRSAYGCRRTGVDIREAWGGPKGRSVFRRYVLAARRRDPGFVAPYTYYWKVGLADPSFELNRAILTAMAESRQRVVRAKYALHEVRCATDPAHASACRPWP